MMCTAFAGCIGVRSGASQRQEQLDRIDVTLRLRPHIAEARLLIKTLGVENLQHADVAFMIAPACQIEIVASGILGARLRIELLGVVIERLQYIGNLTER